MSISLTELLDRVSNFEKLSQQEQVKTVAYFHCIESKTDVFSVSDIKNCFQKENLRLPSNINRDFSILTIGKSPVFLKKSNGYFFERSAKKQLEELYFKSNSKKVISSSLRSLLLKINNSPQQRDFLEECIRCFEIEAYRASVVMCWLLAIDTVYEYILKHKVVEFNAAIQSHGKYKKIHIINKDDFTDIKESDFIELLRVSKIVSNDTRKLLDEKLGFRNTCAHPNTITIRDSKAIAFIEDIVENILTKYNS